MREGADLVRATAPFAVEDRARTWRLLGVSVALHAGAVVGTLVAPTGLKPVGAVLIALLMLRLFAFTHDAGHGAIFRDSPFGRGITWAIGVYTLNMPSIWREGHDRHHRSTSRPLTAPLSGLRLGDCLNRTVSTPQWAALCPADRRRYRAVRHPLVLALGLVVIFAVGHCLAPLARRQWQGLVALAVWAGALAGINAVFGPANAVFVLVLPGILGSALGAYLFYAQHNFPTARIAEPQRWELVAAALDGASFFEMPLWMHWFTGNIGYHHVHHVNHRIPFYRLPEAMAAIPELQHPRCTSWHPREVIACLRSSVWDPANERMVSFAEAERQRHRLNP